MTASTNETACDWTVSGMDCGSCATKIKDAVARLPGVNGVEIGIRTERLRLTLDEAQTGRDKIEKTIRALGYKIAPRTAPAKKEFVLRGEVAAKQDGREHGAENHDGQDLEGHDHAPQADPAKKRDETGHGSPGHVHDDPADRGKRWYQTGKGKLMTIAAIGALFINAAEEAALVVFLFVVGEVLEGVAAGRARDGIRALANLVPNTAMLEGNGTTQEVPAASL